MISQNTRLGFPRSVRIIKSEDFGKLLRSENPGAVRLGRDLVSINVLPNKDIGRVRFGFTVGKHNVPRSVDRALVKRVLRDCCRKELPNFRALASELAAGLEIGLRLRQPLKNVGRAVTVAEAKASVRKSAEACLRAAKKRLPEAVERFLKAAA